MPELPVSTPLLFVGVIFRTPTLAERGGLHTGGWGALADMRSHQRRDISRIHRKRGSENELRAAQLGCELPASAAAGWTTGPERTCSLTGSP